jgi:hypothetical protein
MAAAHMHTYELPGGLSVRFKHHPEVHRTAFTLSVHDGERLLSRTCSCNGVSMDCPDPKSPSCDCTTNPPTLSCV